LSQSSINVGEETTILKGNVTCSNADCGTVYVYAKNASGISINAIPGLSVLDSNPYYCSYYLYANSSLSSSCAPSWAIKGLIKGSYLLYLIAAKSGGGLTSDSNEVMLTVTEIPTGTVSVALSASPAIVTVGSASTIHTDISCSGASTARCGNVTSYLAAPTALDINPAGPQKPASCKGLKAGQTCSVNWTASSSVQGVYYLYTVADSDNPNVTNATGNAMLNVTNKPFIQIDSISLPSQIKLGETRHLVANISCQSNTFACGTVKASLRYNGTTGLTILNPEKDCGNMVPSSACPVSWNIIGNTAAAYRLEISANSSSANVVNTSASSVLVVHKNLGLLSVSAADPAKIDLKTSQTNSTTLSAVINCSTEYCGSVNVAVWSEGVLLSPSTTVSTEQNQQVCNSFPCSRQWTLKSSSEGSYSITILARSNESIEANSNTTLVVEGYNPLLALSSNMAGIMAKAGQPVQIRTTVTCYTKRCGQVTVSLACLSGSMNFIPYNEPNPVNFSEMLAGQSGEVVWNVSFAQAGPYTIGISASGSAENITNVQVTGTINVTNVVGKVGILLPMAGAAYSRGDVVPLKAMITADDKPVSGLSPFTYQLGGVTLQDAGNGIYQGTGTIPVDADERYELTFRAGEYESSTYILVEPMLSVSLSTDKASYSGMDKLKISGEVKKGDAPTDANVTLVISHSSGLWSKEIRLNAPGGLYSYEGITAPNIDGRIKISAKAQDNYTNSGENDTEVSVTGRTGDLYKISFELSKYNYSRSENIPFTLRITDMGVPQAGLRVTCNIFGEDIEELDEGGTAGVYYGRHTIPVEATIKEESLSCEAFGAKNGTGFVNIKIEPMELRMTVVSPKMLPNNIMYVFSDNVTVLEIEVRNPDGTPVTDAVLEVTLGNKTTNMTHIGGGSYKADVMFKGSGISEMVLTAQDPRGNRGDSNISLVVNPSQIEWWWLLLIPLGMGILFALWIYKKSKEPPKIEIQEKIIRLPTVERVREVIYRPVRMPQAQRPRVDPLTKLRDEISRLEEKSRTTQEAKELAEQQYYKRQIDEATFNKLMQDYEEKLIEIYAALKQKRKELSGA